MLDQTDKRILSLLAENSRMQLQEIGEEVHLNGKLQAIGFAEWKRWESLK